MSNKPVKTFLPSLLCLIVLAALYTWPLVTNPSGLSIIKPEKGTDYYFNMWVVHWGSHALFTDPLNLHQANIFFPERNTFAYSDIELSHSILLAPVILLGKDPHLSNNILILLSMVIGGTGFLLLGRKLTGSWLAGLFGAALFVSNPTHFGRIYQVQFFCDHWLPWLILCLYLWLESLEVNRRVYLWSALSAVAFCLHALTGSHNTIWGVLIVVFFMFYYFVVKKLWGKISFWISAALMFIIVAIILLPVFLPYFEISDHLSASRAFSEHIFRSGAADTVSLLSANTSFYRWLEASTGWPRQTVGYKPGSFLFPGMILSALFFLSVFMATGDKRTRRETWAHLLDFIAFLVLIWAGVAAFGKGGMGIMHLTPLLMLIAVSALLIICRFMLFADVQHLVSQKLQKRTQLISNNLHAFFWILVAIIFVWFSFGPDGYLYYLTRAIPMAGMIRVVSRFMIPAAFAISLVATFGIARLLKKQKRVGILLVSIIMCLFVAESIRIPFPTYKATRFSEAYSWIGKQEGDFSVFEYPLVPTVNDPVKQMSASFHHWKNLVVGYSGYESLDYVQRRDRLYSTFPKDVCLEELRELEVRYILIRDHHVDKKTMDAIKTSDELQFQQKLDGILIYRLD